MNVRLVAALLCLYVVVFSGVNYLMVAMAWPDLLRWAVMMAPGISVWGILGARWWRARHPKRIGPPMEWIG